MGVFWALWGLISIPGPTPSMPASPLAVTSTDVPRHGLVSPKGRRPWGDSSGPLSFHGLHLKLPRSLSLAYLSHLPSPGHPSCIINDILPAYRPLPFLERQLSEDMDFHPPSWLLCSPLLEGDLLGRRCLHNTC